MTTNNLLWVLDYLKERFNGDFYISDAVKKELIDKPLASKKFKFEALQVSFRVKKAVLNIVETPQIKALAEELQGLANKTFKVKGNWLKIVHYAEMETLAAAIILNASAVVIDERTTKLLVENPQELTKMFGRMLRAKVFVNKKNLEKIHQWVKSIKILRSVELVLIAYEKGILNKYLLEEKDARKTLVESLLWGVKLHGCAISRREIDELVALETAGK